MAEQALDFELTEDSAFFDRAADSVQRPREVATKRAPGRELPAGTPSLEVQAHTISS